MRPALIAATLAISCIAGTAGAQDNLWRNDGYQGDPAREDDNRFFGDRGDWTTIGHKIVSSRVDNDRLRVRGQERFRKLRLCALNRPFELRAMSARFHNGEVQNFAAGQIVRAGTCTRAFDLIGRRRNITEIRLTFAKLRRGEEPEVRIQAR